MPLPGGLALMAGRIQRAIFQEVLFILVMRKVQMH